MSETEPAVIYIQDMPQEVADVIGELLQIVHQRLKHHYRKECSERLVTLLMDGDDDTWDAASDLDECSFSF